MKKKLNKERIGALITLMLGTVVCVAICNHVKTLFVTVDTPSIVSEEGSFLGKYEERQPATVAYDAPQSEIVKGNTISGEGLYQKTLTHDDIFRGDLVPSSKEFPMIASASEETVNLTEYSNEYYTVSGTSSTLNKKAADALNKLMANYNANTDLRDFSVYGTTSTYNGFDSPCPKQFTDSVGGNTVDLALIGYTGMISYDGLDEEGWVNQNCNYYGYIVRYPQNKTSFTGEGYCPWHLRYVGLPHSFIMKENNLCLEEYVRFLKSFSAESPLEATVDNKKYWIYSVPSMGDVTYIDVPLNGQYSVSGDGETGYIITVTKR